MKKLRISCTAISSGKVDTRFKLCFEFEVFFGDWREKLLIIEMVAKDYGNDDLLKAMLLQSKTVTLVEGDGCKPPGKIESIEYVGDAETFLKWLRLDIDAQFNTVENKKLLTL